MEMAQSKSHGRCIKFSPLLLEILHFPEMHEQLSTSDKLHDKKDTLLSLEHIFHSHQKWMIGFEQNIPFQEC